MGARTLDELARDGFIAADWAEALRPVEGKLAEVGAFLRAESAAGHRYLPAPDRILRVFRTPLSEVRVLIVGQDPYPTPGHPIGLAFAVDAHVRPVPRSLQNMYQELRDDLGIPPAPHGDLSRWSRQGVFLLNRVLTVRAGDSGSHRGHGWEEVTECAIDALAARGGPLVAILWGRDAGSLRPRLQGVPAISSPHPSPLSASRGFFGSRPFSKANALLREQGADEIDWRVEVPEEKTS